MSNPISIIHSRESIYYIGSAASTNWLTQNPRLLSLPAPFFVRRIAGDPVVQGAGAERRRGAREGKEGDSGDAAEGAVRAEPDARILGKQGAGVGRAGQGH